MKYIYRVLSMREYDSKEYFFSSKRLAEQFISKQIKNDNDDGDFGSSGDKKVAKYLKDKNWEKLGPFYSLWLLKVKLDDVKGILVYGEDE